MDTTNYGRPICPSEKAASDSPEDTPSKAIGCHALDLGRVVTASARGNLPFLLKWLPEHPMVSAVLEELKTVDN